MLFKIKSLTFVLYISSSILKERGEEGKRQEGEETL